MKKIMILLLMSAAICCTVSSPALAKKDKEAGDAKPAKNKAAMVKIEIRGRIEMAEKESKTGKTITSYYIIDADGQKVKLPSAASKKKGGKAIDLAEYADADVKLCGMGRKSAKKGKEKIALRKITSIERLEEEEEI